MNSFGFHRRNRTAGWLLLIFTLGLASGVIRINSRAAAPVVFLVRAVFFVIGLGVIWFLAWWMLQSV